VLYSFSVLNSAALSKLHSQLDETKTHGQRQKNKEKLNKLKLLNLKGQNIPTETRPAKAQWLKDQLHIETLRATFLA
jgi:hypothetical protein